jgi:hypothetical protein
MLWRRLGVAVVCLGVTPRLAICQDSTVQQVVGGWHLREHVRVETRDGMRFYGRYLGSRSDSFTLSSPVSREGRAVPLDTVRRLWVQHGTHAVQGAFIGGLAAPLAVGVFFGGFTNGDQCPSASCLLSSVWVGAVVGGVTGLLFPRWHLVYARDNARLGK